LQTSAAALPRSFEDLAALSSSIEGPPRLSPPAEPSPRGQTQGFATGAGMDGLFGGMLDRIGLSSGTLSSLIGGSSTHDSIAAGANRTELGGSLGVLGGSLPLPAPVARSTDGANTIGWHTDSHGLSGLSGTALNAPPGAMHGVPSVPALERVGGELLPLASSLPSTSANTPPYGGGTPLSELSPASLSSNIVLPQLAKLDGLTRTNHVPHHSQAPHSPQLPLTAPSWGGDQTWSTSPTPTVQSAVGATDEARRWAEGSQKPGAGSCSAPEFASSSRGFAPALETRGFGGTFGGFGGSPLASGGPNSCALPPAGAAGSCAHPPSLDTIAQGFGGNGFGGLWDMPTDSSSHRPSSPA
jgi:hypothetical protein